MVEIIAVVISSLALVAIIILLIFVIKKNKSNPTDQKEIGSIETKIELSNERIKSSISDSMKDAVITLGDQNRKNNEVNNEKLERFQKSIVEQMDTKFNALNKQVDDKLSEINKKVDEKLGEGFANTSKTMQALSEQLGKIDEAQKNLQGLSGDVSSLKKVLENNQSRGKYGEYQLSAILHNIYGDTKEIFEEQYTIRKGREGDDVRADVAIFPKGKENEFICIDSKFPFQDYSKMIEAEDPEEKERIRKDFVSAVKKHITDIKNKYIIPGRTIGQAIMFIPNDGVFAFIHHDCYEAVEYARESNVIITSPSTLQAILVTVNLLRIDFERSKKITEITKSLQKLGSDFTIFSREWGKFSRNLSLVESNKASLDDRVNRINGKFSAISGNTVETIEEDVSFDDENN